MFTSEERVVIAMSGGVDSSVCALLMKEQGLQCIGMTMRLWKGEEAESSCSLGSCCGAESVEDARLVAETIGIPYYPINFRKEFWEGVVSPFVEEYSIGRTPNPCIRCNEKLKFVSLYEKAVEIGASKVCTGHYARIRWDENTQRWQLWRGVNAQKDQSYFLFSMTQEQLAITCFPIGKYETKKEIRQIAEQHGLVTAKKPESMDICFVPDKDYAGFIARHFPDKLGKKGSIRHVSGQLLGEHKGIHHFTIGQRKGLRVSYHEPLYVKDLIPETGEVVVGNRTEACWEECRIEQMNWIDPLPQGPIEVSMKLRSRGMEVVGKVIPESPHSALVQFLEPQLGVTPGQAAVFYAGPRVVGGGWISR